MTIEIIRHGLTALQTEHRYQGWTDAPLSKEGREILLPSEEKPELLFVSPLVRAKETASVLFPSVCQVVIPDLKEMNFGVFEKRNAAEMEKDAQYRKWVDSACETTCLGGESREEFSRRAVLAFCDLMDKASSVNVRNVVIVAHGGTQMAVMERFALPKRSYFEWHLDSGMGFLCSGENWKQDHKIKFIRVTNHNRS